MFGALQLSAGAEMMGVQGRVTVASVLAFVRQRRRNSQLDGQRRDFASVFQRRWIGEFKLAGEVLQHQAVCQAAKQSAFMRLQQVR